MLANRQEIVLSLPDGFTKAEEVLRIIGEVLPQLKPSLASSRLAVNHEFVSAEQTVPLDAEVALIGMVSGG